MAINRYYVFSPDENMWLTDSYGLWSLWSPYFGDAHQFDTEDGAMVASRSVARRCEHIILSSTDEAHDQDTGA